MKNVLRVQCLDTLRITTRRSLEVLPRDRRGTYITRQVQRRSSRPPSVIKSILPILSMCQTFLLYLSQPSTQRSPLASHNSSPSCIRHRQCPMRSYFLNRWITFPLPPASTSPYIKSRISQGSLVKSNAFSWLWVICRLLRMLLESLCMESIDGSGSVRERLRILGRGARGGSPFTILASSSGARWSRDARCSSQSLKHQTSGAI